MSWEQIAEGLSEEFGMSYEEAFTIVRYVMTKSRGSGVRPVYGWKARPSGWRNR